MTITPTALRAIISALSVYVAICTTPSKAETLARPLRACVESLIHTTALFYACAYIVNSDAEDKGGPHQVVTEETEGISILFSNSGHKGICGSITFLEPVAGPMLAKSLDLISYYNTDVYRHQAHSISASAMNIAHLQISQDKDDSQRVITDTKERLRLAVDAYLAMFEGTLFSVPLRTPIKMEPETCSVLVDGVRSHIPRAVPPELSTLQNWPQVEKNYRAALETLNTLMPKMAP